MTENKEDKKMYYCEEKQAICLTASCTKGKEISYFPDISNDTILLEGDGYVMESLTFKDGTEKIIDCSILVINGCENRTENNKYSKEFLDTLKQLCLEFDSKAESYPDPDYVGFALYFYATHPGYDLHNGYGGSIEIQTDWSEGGDEWIEELNKKE